jgi:TPR repeat protein
MRRIALFAALLLLGCSQGDAPPPAPSGAVASAAASATASAEAPLPTATTKLARKKTPRERRIEDEKRCEAGELAGCRRAADRYRGYGHIAGCGVDREGKPPRRMVTAADAESDAKSFDKWIRKACDLGDDDACLQGIKNLTSPGITPRVVDACARGSAETCPLYLWATGMRPGAKKALDHDRHVFLTHGFHGYLFTELYRKEKTKGGATLPPEVADLARRICKTTGECDDVFMMLDKNGWGPEALASLRNGVGDDLAAACLEGDCTCGEAARYLDPSDARVLDLAQIGCAEGEPDACFVLGDRYERGAGVPKDDRTALRYYEIACPRVLAGDDREEVYSKPACARLAERYAGSGPDERLREYHYASLACSRPGMERDHAPCVRRALLHYQHGFRSDFITETSAHAGQRFLNGNDEKECERPSVRAECEKAKAIIR